MKTVYLAGPIAGCDRIEANNWRDGISEHLADAGIRGISPLRCEPLIGERYTNDSPDPRFGTPRAIASKNFLDVQTCDLTLAYLPRSLNERRLSVGTIIELAWAHALRKPTILVSDYVFVTQHPVVQANAGWIVATLDEAVDIITGIFGEYAR